MKKLFITIAIVTVAISGFAQHKTSAHFWGRVPSYPSKGTIEDFRKFIDEIQTLSAEINEEADKQNELMQQKVSTVTPASIQNPQNMNPAEIQKMMKRTQDRTDFMNEMNKKFSELNAELQQLTSDYEKEYATKVQLLEDKAKKICPEGAMSKSDEARVPACDAALKELDAAKEGLVTKWFLSGNSAFKGWLAKYEAMRKGYEPKIIQVRDDSFIGTGVNVKGLPCAENVKGVNEYLALLQQVFQKAMDNNLLK